VNLSDCRRGASVRVLDVDVAEHARLRIEEMGLRPGVVVRVTHLAAFGGVVVAAGGARVGLDAATARRVRAEPAPGRAR
jgi:ferrous iron transport protein A